ncbi:hypothetical protein ABK040_007020 [Willaertia magna]
MRNSLQIVTLFCFIIFSILSFIETKESEQEKSNPVASSGAGVKIVYVEKSGKVVVEDYDYLFSFYISQLACHVLSFIYPAYASFKAIKSKGGNDDKQWLTYWIIYAIVHVVEYYMLIIVTVIPLYWEIKILFILWLMAPQTRGATIIYVKYVQPFLKKHESAIDKELSQVKQRVADTTKRVSSRIVSAAIGQLGGGSNN